MTLPLPLWILAALIGPCLGSYATTAALRWANDRQSTWGRSRCDHCGVVLSFAQTMPIASFIWRRGACRGCGSRIDPAHLAGEIAGCLILLPALAAAPSLRAILLSAIGLLLLFSAICDAKTQRLPDTATLAIAVIALALAFSRSVQTLVVGALAAVLTFVLVEGVRRAFLWLHRKPSLGFGDVKLLAALALWTGAMTPWVVVAAAALGLTAVSLRRPSNGRLAFGPYIAAAAWMVGVGGEARLWPMLG